MMAGACMKPDFGSFGVLDAPISLPVLIVL